MSTDVARRDDRAAIEQLHVLRDKLHVEASLTQADSSAWRAGLITSIAGADSLEALNELAVGQSAPSGQDLVGRTLVIRDFAVQRQPEDQESVLGVFLIIDAVDSDTGEEITFTCGGDTVVAQLNAVQENIGFPVTGTLMSMKKGKGDVLYFRFRTVK